MPDKSIKSGSFLCKCGAELGLCWPADIAVPKLICPCGKIPRLILLNEYLLKDMTPANSQVNGEIQ